MKLSKHQNHLRNVFFSLALAICVRGDDTLEHGTRIVGGSQTTAEKFPYQAAILTQNTLICGGSILAKNWILTAAQCFNKVNQSSSLRVRVGSSDYSKGGQVLKVQRIITHPKYNPRYDYDVALLEIETLAITPSVMTIAVAETPPKVGTVLTATGWGVVKTQGEFPKIVRSMQLVSTDWEVCRTKYDSLTERMICAMTPEKGPCEKDGGGGLVENGRVYGIVSFGIGCGSGTFPNVFTNVANAEIRGFICSNTKLC